DIYRSILFLKQNNPHTIYDNYISKLNIHSREMKEVKNHDFYCVTHEGFIQIAINQIESNLKALNGVQSMISKLI
ncbi:MAG: hypothetical protein ACK5B9_15205, partial [Flavobacteriia bacterium]